jgi:hypothetical protein
MLNSEISDFSIFNVSLNQDLVEKFKIVFLAHGVLGRQDPNSYEKIKNFSEYDKLTIVPLIFYFLPVAAFQESRSLGEPIKPLIKEHLKTLSWVVIDDELTDILKAISEQYFVSKIRRYIKRKGMSDLRLNRSLYKRIRSRQGERCCICGTKFDTDTDCRESLDHIIPYYLIGDIMDGSNWQILCEPCNRGKSCYISCLQAPEALNWIYMSAKINEITETSRYVALMNNAKCMHSSCNNNTSNSKLSVILKTKTGLSVPKHLEVLCEEHTMHS